MLWLQNTNILSSGPLIISSIQLSDEGIYKCRVSVKGARIEKPVQLNVIGNQIAIITVCIIIVTAVEFTVLEQYYYDIMINMCNNIMFIK